MLLFGLLHVMLCSTEVLAATFSDGCNSVSKLCLCVSDSLHNYSKCQEEQIGCKARYDYDSFLSSLESNVSIPSVSTHESFVVTCYPFTCTINIITADNGTYTLVAGDTLSLSGAADFTGTIGPNIVWAAFISCSCDPNIELRISLVALLVLILHCLMQSQ